MNKPQETNSTEKTTQHKTYSFEYATFKEFFHDLRKALLIYLVK